jgi:hypothetical protein
MESRQSMRGSILALAFVVGCGNGGAPAPESAAQPTYVVEVLGDEGGLELFSTSIAGLVPVPFSNEPNRPTPESFQTIEPWTTITGSSYSVVTSIDQSPLSMAPVAPYLCAGYTDFRERLNSGQRARETHQIFVNSMGGIELDTDFDHVLAYRCEWFDTDNRVQGVTSVLAAPARCDGQGDVNSSLLIAGHVRDQDVSIKPEICWAQLTPADSSHAVVTLTVPLGSATLSVNADHCLDGDVFPATFTVPVANPCQLAVTAMITDAAIGSASRLILKSGSWTITSLDPSKGGRERGSFDLNFAAGSDTLSVSGSYDLRVTRIP